MAGKLPKADSAILLNSPHHKHGRVSGMDEEQSSSLLVLESSRAPQSKKWVCVSLRVNSLLRTQVLGDAITLFKSEPSHVRKDRAMLLQMRKLRPGEMESFAEAHLQLLVSLCLTRLSDFLQHQPAPGGSSCWDLCTFIAWFTLPILQSPALSRASTRCNFVALLTANCPLPCPSCSHSRGWICCPRSGPPGCSSPAVSQTPAQTRRKGRREGWDGRRGGEAEGRVASVPDVCDGSSRE